MNHEKEIRVLIVDDDPLVIEMIIGRLEGSRFIIAGKATNGLLAVEMVKKIKPDIVLMDIEMPKMNGIEATQTIYDTCPTPVVMLTAYEKLEFVEKAGDAGAGAYLVKVPLYKEIERAITIAIARFDDMMKLRALNEKLLANNEKLKEALDNVQKLSGLLPICASCKKIRDDQGYWNQLESYIEHHSEALFSHSICPSCADTLYGETQWYKKMKKDEKNS